MDPKLNFQETLQCQHCQVYVSKACQQVHQANCQLVKNQNQQGIINNNDNKSFIPINNQNQSKDIFSNFQQVTFKQVPQKTQQQTDIQNTQNTQKIFPLFQCAKVPIQNVQFQDTQKKGNQQNQQSFIPLDSNSERRFQGIRFVTKESPSHNKDLSQEQFPQPKLLQTPTVIQQNQFSGQILLHQQQQNTNGIQFKPEQGSNQLLNNQQNQISSFGDIQSQSQNQEKSKIFKTQNLNNNGNINLQLHIPSFKRQDNNQQKEFNFNGPPQTGNKFQNKNFQQIQPQQIQQQQQHSIFISQSNIQSQFQNNRQPDSIQPISLSQPIQGLPSIPHQFMIPQMPQNIQPPPFISSFFNRFKYNPQNQEDDDDNDDDNEYDSFNPHSRGLPNFDVNKQYTDVEVNRMNQEQFYQYFSNLYINENRGYSEDQINEKIFQNFSMKVEDIRIDICVICQESFTQETFTTDKQLPCSHLFHEDCLIGWLIRSKQCPICKAEVEL